MKPDAHKRKKNAIYKKKHGIVTVSKSVDSPKDKPDLQKDNAKQGTKQCTAGQASSSGVAIAAAADPKLLKLPLTKTSDDDDDDDEVGDQSALFSRRKLVSNWERYEEAQPEPGEEPEEPEPEVDLDYMRSFTGTAKALLEQESKRDEFCMYNDTDVPCEQFISIDMNQSSAEKSASSSTSHEPSALKKSQIEAVIDESDNLRAGALAGDTSQSKVIQTNTPLLNDDGHNDTRCSNDKNELVLNDPWQSDPVEEQQVLNELLSAINLQRNKHTTPPTCGHTEYSASTLSDNISDQKENSSPNSNIKEDSENVEELFGSLCLSSKEEVPKSATLIESNSRPNSEPGLLSMKTPLSYISHFSSNTRRKVSGSVPAVQNVPSLSELEDDLDLLLAM